MDEIRRAPRVLLVSMPFVPVNIPGLGVSTLKSALRQAGIRAEIYYAALDWFRFYLGEVPPIEALTQYSFVASSQDFGDVFFAETLWPEARERALQAIGAMATVHNTVFSPDRTLQVVSALQRYASEARAFIAHCVESRPWEEYDMVGFSSTFAQNVASLALARALRARFPALPIVFGGANCEGEMGRQILRSFPWVDAVIEGEADFSFPEFVQRYLTGGDWRSVHGVLFREDGQIVQRAKPCPVERMDDLPVPDFDDYFAQLPDQLRAIKRRGDLSLAIETSRGCWWGAVSHCTFCGLNPTTMSFRAKSPERAVAELRALSQRYGVKRIEAVDNIISKRYFKEVLPQIEQDGLSLFYETKVNLSEEEVEQLAAAGVHTIQPGVEGLSSEILALMKKGSQGFQSVELLKWCSIQQMRVIWFYLYRFPHEPHAPYLRDVERIPRLFHLPPPRAANPILLDRFSPLFTRRAQIGFPDVRPASLSHIYYGGLSPEERFNICYHFEADLPQGNDLPYETPLWIAVTAWNQAYNRGARFYQFRSPSVTLLVDTRHEGETQALLLTGHAHHVHGALRRATSPARLQRLWPEIVSSDEDVRWDDLALLSLGASLGAPTLPEPESALDLPRLLQILDGLGAVLWIDERWIALAVDCTDPAFAARYGLGDFVRSPRRARAPELPAPELPAPSDPDLLGIAP